MSIRDFTEASLLRAGEYNARRYHYQGIGRYEPMRPMRGELADRKVLANAIPAGGYVRLGASRPASTPASAALSANIHFCDIETPLKQFVALRRQNFLVRHCVAIHAAFADEIRACFKASGLPNIEVRSAAGSGSNYYRPPKSKSATVRGQVSSEITNQTKHVCENSRPTVRRRPFVS